MDLWGSGRRQIGLHQVFNDQVSVSEHGNIYILTVVDFGTRCPDAVALPKIETKRVAEALLDIYSKVGFPPGDPERQGGGGAVHFRNDGRSLSTGKY